MAPFKASEWKPERKVETRLGYPVRILCVDGPDAWSVVGIVSMDGASAVETWHANGSYDFNRNAESPNDLFFADDVEVL